MNFNPNSGQIGLGFNSREEIRFNDIERANHSLHRKNIGMNERRPGIQSRLCGVNDQAGRTVLRDLQSME
jgi:hypothetical protein